MRIATSQFQATMTRSLQYNQGQLSSLSAQMSSGNKIQVPSDDPVTAVRLSRLAREEAILGQYQDNIGAIKIRLSSNETYLQSMVNDINQAHDQLVLAADGSNTGQDLKSMVTTLSALRDSLLYSANEKDQEGNYVFSGTATNVPAISFDGSAAIGARYVFSGNTNQQQSVIGNGIRQAVNVDVSGLESLLNKLDNTIDALSQPSVNPGDPAVRAAISDSMDSADATLELISGKIATFGGAQNIMDTLNGNHANVSLSNQNAIFELNSLDYGEATVALNGYNTALQASYKAYSKISGLSLFNIL
ncbi:flagellar hook-associated protein 3 [Duganella sp. FT134W]|uniref:Flagellar hook-associated protein 3 n=1 Tax=Duganella margarita TaxID=2692170 RepID=A0A7X4H1N9_9BURK|nr:flagellar hook-associated protein FlgL [Duganella margarita]MYM73676.1 flagellar hook-associated protein 3 [Duganella margarita]